MNRVTLDERTRGQFDGLKAAVQVFDESGRFLGLFTPNVSPGLLEPQISKEEIARRSKLHNGRPLADILRDLEGRA